MRELLWSNNATRAGCQERALGALTTYSCGTPSHLVWHRHPSLQLRHLGARATSSHPSDDAAEHLCHRVPPLRRHDDEVRSLRRTPAPTSYKAGTCSHFVKHRHPPLRRAPAPLTSCRGGTMTRCLHSVEPRHSERALLPLTLQMRRQSICVVPSLRTTPAPPGEEPSGRTTQREARSECVSLRSSGPDEVLSLHTTQRGLPLEQRRQGRRASPPYVSRHEGKSTSASPCVTQHEGKSFRGDECPLSHNTASRSRARPSHPELPRLSEKSFFKVVSYASTGTTPPPCVPRHEGKIFSPRSARKTFSTRIDPAGRKIFERV